MAGNVRITFNVSCSSATECGFDHPWTGWLLLSVQWADMDEPAYLFVPLRGPDPGAPSGTGEDTHEVAQGVATAVGDAIGQGTISRDHRDQIKVETNPAPGTPGSRGDTKGRITFQNVTHVDCQATEAKLNLGLAWRGRRAGSTGISGRPREKPPRIVKPPKGWRHGAPGFWNERPPIVRDGKLEVKASKPGLLRWATQFPKMPDEEGKPWPKDDAPPWVEIPYRPRYRQYSFASPLIPRRAFAFAESSNPETKERFRQSGIEPAGFSVQSHSLGAQMQSIGAAIASRGVNVAVDGTNVLVHDAEAVELQLSGDGDAAFPWHIAV